MTAEDPLTTNRHVQARVADRRIVAALLGASALTLAAMVPGGPVETRHFSHIDPAVLAVFNALLVALGLVSLGAIPLVLRGRRVALWVAAAAGAGYAVVYALDIGGIFPTSPDRMPPTLLVLELVGGALGVLLAPFAANVARRAGVDDGPTSTSRITLAVMLAALVLGVVIVAFATSAAMRTG